MVSIEWVVLCEGVFRDQDQRMSLIGIASHMPVPSLPLLLREHLLVARLSYEVKPDYLDIGVGVTTPGGVFFTPDEDDAAMISFSGEYVIVRLRSLPLREEGVHRFEIGLSNGSMGGVNVPVWVSKPAVGDPLFH